MPRDPRPIDAGDAMRSPIAAGLFAALAALPPTATADPQPAQEARQLAQLIDLDIFRKRGFPIRTCEFRCQEERRLCDQRARTDDERRDCRLTYNLCSNDCDIYTPSR